MAIAQQIQIEQLLGMLRAKCDELAALKGSEGELQQTLSIVEDLTRKAQAVAAQMKSLRARRPTAARTASRVRASVRPSNRICPSSSRFFEFDAADKTCPSCGGTLAPMKGQFETSEMIDVVEVSYRVVQRQQQKYACKCGGCVETAPGPERAMPGGRYSLDFAIKVAIDKYLDHIPLARQERILRRHGLPSRRRPSGTNSTRSVRGSESASRALLARVLAEPVIGSTKRAGRDSMAKATSPGRCGA